MIISCCDQGFVVVGGDGDEPVAWSDDAGDSWNLTDDLPGYSNQTAHVACAPVCENIVYAALDGAGIRQPRAYTGLAGRRLHGHKGFRAIKKREKG